MLDASIHIIVTSYAMLHVDQEGGGGFLVKKKMGENNRELPWLRAYITSVLIAKTVQTQQLQRHAYVGVANI